jgi:DNA-binding transcriptional LysR family regulator
MARHDERMDVALVEAMVAVVDYGTFTAAADILHITQPALSRRIRALEREVGTDLFVPAGRRMVLTEVGREMLGPARRILRETAALHAYARSDAELENGVLRVGGLPSLISTCVPDYVALFHHRFPKVRIELVALESVKELVDAVRLARVDVAFGVGDRAPEDVQLEQLGQQDFVVVLPPERTGPSDGEDRPHTPEDAEPGGLVVGVGMLGAHILVTLPRGTSIRAMADAAYERFGLKPRDLLVTTQRDALVLLAVQGAGLTVVPSTLGRLAQRMGGRVAVFPWPLSRRVWLAHRRGERRSAALKGFLELVQGSPLAGDLRAP